MVTPKGSMSTEGETLQFLSYLTSAWYVHPWWRGRCQSCNQVPATQCNLCGRNLITGLTSTASPRVDISSTCKIGQKLECLYLCWNAPLWSDHPGYCTAEVGNPGRTYELLCITTPLTKTNKPPLQKQFLRTENTENKGIYYWMRKRLYKQRETS